MKKQVSPKMKYSRSLFFSYRRPNLISGCVVNISIARRTSSEASKWHGYKLSVKVNSLNHVWLCTPPIHGIYQARVLEWVAISFSRGSSWPRDQTQVSHIVGRRVTVWDSREAQVLPGREYRPSLWRRGSPGLGAVQAPGGRVCGFSSQLWGWGICWGYL